MMSRNAIGAPKNMKCFLGAEMWRACATAHKMPTAFFGPFGPLAMGKGEYGFPGKTGKKGVSPFTVARLPLSYDVGTAVSPWVFNNTNSSAGNCALNCANNCANNVRNNARFRGAVFGGVTVEP